MSRAYPEAPTRRYVLGGLLAVLAGLVAAPGAADDRVWAGAVMRHRRRAVVARYLDVLPAGLEPASQPDRVIIRWVYEGDSGMPSPIEQVRMDRLGDQLVAAVEPDGLATLVAVSIGDGRCEWLFYARAQRDFVNRLNDVLRTTGGKPPLQIELARDPQWGMYRVFRHDATRRLE
ncbi:MAG: DUF695 domain-containing protein [Proteobacteria bacterium]|nr:DUF695 domain-containing protein [Pseudomonadota bacterium]